MNFRGWSLSVGLRGKSLRYWIFPRLCPRMWPSARDVLEWKRSATRFAPTRSKKEGGPFVAAGDAAFAVRLELEMEIQDLIPAHYTSRPTWTTNSESRRPFVYYRNSICQEVFATGRPGNPHSSHEKVQGFGVTRVGSNSRAPF